MQMREKKNIIEACFGDHIKKDSTTCKAVIILGI